MRKDEDAKKAQFEMLFFLEQNFYFPLSLTGNKIFARTLTFSFYSADKRGLDLGLSRGFSGQRAAKHLVGLSNAEFAGGPGKR